MALINCYECGRPNTSDTASACPNCGFNVGNETQKREYVRKVKWGKKEKQSIEDGVCPKCGKNFETHYRREGYYNYTDYTCVCGWKSTWYTYTPPDLGVTFPNLS